MPHFFALTTAFISPLFQTFYFVKVGILCKLPCTNFSLISGSQVYLPIDTLLEKMQGWGGATYGEMGVEGLEEMHYERLGDTTERLEELTITKRFVGTGKFCALT